MPKPNKYEGKEVSTVREQARRIVQMIIAESPTAQAKIRDRKAAKRNRRKRAR
jgi:hypothetical protein